MSSAFAAELREFIRRLGVNDDRLLETERRARALAQGIRDYRAGRFGIGVTPAPCLTYVSGQVVGCLNPTLTALASSTLQLRGMQTGTDYGTYSLATGDYSISLYVDPADVQLEWQASGPGSRWGAPAWNGSNFAVTRCATNTGKNAKPLVASGYGCALRLCNFPLSNTLHLDDSRKGTTGTVITSSGGPNWTNGAYTMATAANPPRVDIFVVVGGVTFIYTFPGPPTSMTCTDSGATKFDSTWTATSSTLGYFVGDTLRIYEP